MGRTCKTPILNVGVSCTAAISKEKVTLTQVCIVPDGLATAVAGGLFIGAVGILVGSGMVAGGVVCGNTGSGEMAFGQSDAHSVTASAPED